MMPPVGLFYEHRTSNIQRPTSNKKNHSIPNYFCFFSAVLMLTTKSLTNSSVSSFLSIQNSMLDVGCSMFMGFTQHQRSPFNPYPKARANIMRFQCIGRKTGSVRYHGHFKVCKNLSFELLTFSLAFLYPLQAPLKSQQHCALSPWQYDGLHPPEQPPAVPLPMRVGAATPSSDTAMLKGAPPFSFPAV